jgi:hypothetical protein
MNKNKRLVYMPVAPEFKTKLKLESTLKNMSVIQYTRELANGEDENQDFFTIKKGKRFKLDF